MLSSADAIAVLLIALAADAVIGDPDRIWRRYPHPVVWFGTLIAALDQRMNREGESFNRRRLRGGLALVLVLGICGGVALAVQRALDAMPWSILTTGLIASVLLAQNALYVHVARVRSGFASGGLTAARQAVSMIVGRDPESLDEAGVARAAIETTAENFSDGVIAPAFWLLIGGLPGLVLYKAINTADSMIGHRSPRYLAFGYAAARLDDLVNLIPARLSGLLLALVAPVIRGSVSIAFRTMLRDARLHRSPNAGWPEAAAAGALGLALAGPRRYGALLVEDPFLNASGRRDATPDDIDRMLRLMVAASALFAVLMLLLWVIVTRVV